MSKPDGYVLDFLRVGWKPSAWLLGFYGGFELAAKFIAPDWPWLHALLAAPLAAFPFCFRLVLMIALSVLCATAFGWYPEYRRQRKAEEEPAPTYRAHIWFRTIGSEDHLCVRNTGSLTLRNARVSVLIYIRGRMEPFAKLRYGESEDLDPREEWHWPFARRQPGPKGAEHLSLSNGQTWLQLGPNEEIEFRLSADDNVHIVKRFRLLMVDGEPEATALPMPTVDVV